MKIRVYSDIHQEVKDIFNIPLFEIAKLPDEEDHVLVLAGDYFSFRDLKHNHFKENIIGLSKRFKHIVYVFGNHEYYNGKIGGIYNQKNINAIQELANNISVLSRHSPSVVIDGVKFIGATLWTDFGGKELPSISIKDTMNDFKYIKSAHSGFSKYKPKHWLYEHISDINWIKREVEQSTDLPVVVVTHHAPYSEARDPIDDPEGNYGKFYTSNQDDFIIKNEHIKIWIHGHIHYPFDYMLNKTRVFSNPMDYGVYEDENPHRGLIEITS